MNMQDTGTRAFAANYYISRFYHLANRCELDGDALLRRAAIDPEIVDSPGQRVEADKLAAVLVDIWDALQDEAMKLAAYPVPRGSFYMMGKLTIHEASLHKALEQIVRFYSLVTKAFSLDVSVKGKTASLRVTMNAPELDPEHLLAELNLMGLHRYCSWLIAENIPLKKVYFSYPRPRQVTEYAFLFPGRHEFDAPYMGFDFSSKYMDYKCVQSSGALKTFMRNCPVELFKQPKTDFSLSGEVKALLQQHPGNEIPSIDSMAKALHMARRTLIRKLRDEGSSFQQIKDLIRRDRAIRLLSSQSYSVADVADQLGYSDPSVFARAFRSWTGQSPRDYRAEFAPKQPAD